MSNSIIKKFADELKESRKKNKITIDQIFTKTRIDKKYLNAIEDGNFSILPDVYIRAFIKEYANTIGLDSNDVLTNFELAQKNEDYSNKHVVESEPEKIEKKDDAKIVSSYPEESTNSEKQVPQSTNDKTFYYVLAGIVILLAIFIIYKTFLTEENTNIVTEKPFEEIVESNSENKLILEKDKQEDEEDANQPIITPKKENLVAQEVKRAEISTLDNLDKIQSDNSSYPLNLTIIGVDQSWMRIVTDEKENTEFVISKDMKRVIGAQTKIYLHIGNSGGVKLQLNNNDLYFSGAPGKVRKIFVTKNGIEYLRRTPVMKNEG